jgi:hypothetical protein
LGLFHAVHNAALRDLVKDRLDAHFRDTFGGADTETVTPRSGGIRAFMRGHLLSGPLLRYPSAHIAIATSVITKSHNGNSKPNGPKKTVLP